MTKRQRAGDGTSTSAAAAETSARADSAVCRPFGAVSEISERQALPTLPDNSEPSARACISETVENPAAKRKHRASDGISETAGVVVRGELRDRSASRFCVTPRSFRPGHEVSGDRCEGYGPLPQGANPSPQRLDPVLCHATEPNPSGTRSEWTPRARVPGSTVRPGSRFPLARCAPSARTPRLWVRERGVGSTRARSDPSPVLRPACRGSRQTPAPE